MKKVTPVIWGLAIIALGVIFGGNALGIFNIDIFFKGWWTLFIIVPSFISIFTEKEKISSLAFLAAGVVFLLAAQDVFSYDVAWKVILGIVLVAIGLSIIVKTVFHTKSDKEVERKIATLKGESANKEMENLTAVFSGSDRVYNNENFSGANLVAVFGGAGLDLRNAIFTKDTVINAFCLFGGIDIKVPENVQIKTRSGFVFGGVSDDRKGNSDKAKYTIYIDAAGGFGGISIDDKAKKAKKD
ncbi:hypothetical protein IJ114_02940 [Candidatus Saccharibacteria bacterium]|nr:hypothetical protein [Candidatus Saccharibacteria bacterium]